MQSVILGTAQWGLDYGVTNTLGRLSDEVIGELVETAGRTGVSALDTAPAYGDAEERIGMLAPDFPIQTKVSITGSTALPVAVSVSESLAHLRQDRLSAVLVHDWSSASTHERNAAAAALEELRADGVVGSVGVSVYVEDEVESALTVFARLDLVQVPVSILDQRLEGSAEVAEVRARGGRVQARSVLLQGAAVAAEDHPGFGRHPDVVRLRATGRPLQLCLGYASSREWIDELVVASTTSTELAEIMSGLAEPGPRTDWGDYASSDPWLIDPRRWTSPSGEG